MLLDKLEILSTGSVIDFRATGQVTGCDFKATFLTLRDNELGARDKGQSGEKHLVIHRQ